jgi:hypothetical protein
MAALRVPGVYRHHLEDDLSMLAQERLKSVLTLSIGHASEVPFVQSMIRTVGQKITGGGFHLPVSQRWPVVPGSGLVPLIAAG